MRVFKIKQKKLLYLVIISFFSFFLFPENLTFNRLGYTRLENGWDFFPRKSSEETMELLQEGQTAPYQVFVPSYWNSIFASTDHPEPENYGCYHYQIKNLSYHEKYAFYTKDSPGTSCAVYINGQLLAQNGNPFEMLKSPEERNTSGCSIVKPLYCEFSPTKAGVADIVVFISNYYYRKSGLWDTVFIGDTESINRLDNTFLIFYSVISGILIFIGLLNILQFIINKKHKEHLFLGLAAIVFALRVSTAGYSSISVIMPFLPSEIEIKLEYLVLWLAPTSILQMLYTLYPAQNSYILFKWLKEKPFRYTIFALNYVLGIISLIVPAYYSNRMVPILQIGFGIVALYVIIYIIINIVRKRKYIYYYLTGCLFLIVGGAYDVVYTKSKDLLPISLFPFLLVMFIFVQLILLATIQNDVYKDTVRISGTLQNLNEAYLRFVPREFLKLLDKDSVVKIQPGDYSDIQMCIMFSKLNIRSLKLSSSLDDKFVIFNDFLKHISPIIKLHNGFVSKFLSGGFMALFPSSEADAIMAALDIRDFVHDFKLSSVCANHLVDVRIGIHYGKMIAGTLGEAGRLDDTVISDTVNTVARIESVCERLNKNIIISQSLKNQIENNNDLYIKLTELESISVKGKSKPLTLFEVSDLFEE